MTGRMDQGPSILIIDDDGDIRTLVQGVLQRSGMRGDWTAAISGFASWD